MLIQLALENMRSERCYHEENFAHFLTIITLSSAMFLGGCSMLNSRSEREEMIQIAKSKR